MAGIIIAFLLILIPTVVIFFLCFDKQQMRKELLEKQKKSQEEKNRAQEEQKEQKLMEEEQKRLEKKRMIEEGTWIGIRTRAKGIEARKLYDLRLKYHLPELDAVGQFIRTDSLRRKDWKNRIGLVLLGYEGKSGLKNNPFLSMFLAFQKVEHLRELMGELHRVRKALEKEDLEY